MDNSIFNKRNIRIAVVVITDIIMTALASGLAVLTAGISASPMFRSNIWNCGTGSSRYR